MYCTTDLSKVRLHMKLAEAALKHKAIEEAVEQIMLVTYYLAAVGCFLAERADEMAEKTRELDARSHN